jgi:ribosomal protein S18 acetylase RimI-like enzyme
MMIVSYTLNYQESLYKYYQKCVDENPIFVMLEKDIFNQMMQQSLSFLSVDQDQVDGFLMTHQKQNETYITMFFGDNIIQSNLMNALVDHLKNTGCKTIWVHFFNPISLSWYPKEGIIHPCYQGEVMGSKMHKSYLNWGFQEHSIQDTFYLKLDNYQQDETVTRLLLEHHLEKITYQIYDRNIHKGLHQFLEDIKALHWKETLLNNDQSEKPLPLLVALDNNVVIGFAGPLKVEDSGRGYFAGIGILDSYRNKKIGKVLFHKLVIQLRHMNASYMTLFTGRENKARHIYMGAGFEILKSFVTLKLHL